MGCGQVLRSCEHAAGRRFDVGRSGSRQTVAARGVAGNYQKSHGRRFRLGCVPGSRAGAGLPGQGRPAEPPSPLFPRRRSRRAHLGEQLTSPACPGLPGPRWL